MKKLIPILRPIFRPLAVALIAAFSGFLAPLPSAFAAEEEYYTWVDENGVTNYAERNPEGINATYVGQNRAFGRRAAEPRRPQGNQENSNALPSSEPNDIDPDALVNENAAILAAEVAETRRKNCDIGKNNLAQLKAFARIRVSDDNGENRIMTDDEKEAKAEEARIIIRENCAG